MPRWCALKVRLDCPECGSAILVDGPYKQAPCAACGARVPMADTWSWLVERALEDGAGGKTFRLHTLISAGQGRPGHIFLAVNKGHPPICSRCDEVLDEVDGGGVPDGKTGDFHCPACGAAHPTWPAPGYLKHAGVRQVFLAPPEDAAPEVAAGPAPKPVLFACPNCGGSLKIDGATKRVCTCTYCDVDAYLPAELWNQLHPVRRRRAFWLRCE